jgi:hypothetical protein
MGTMSDSALSAVIETAEKNHRKLQNKNVKAAVLEVQYAALCREAFVKHLHAKVALASSMVHSRRQTLIENQALLAKIKVGDWVFGTEDMSPGINSEGGYGCIAATHPTEQIGNAKPTVESFDIHWLIANRFERRVKVSRLTVVPMPYKSPVPTLRFKKQPKQIDVFVKPPPERTRIEWLEYGLKTRKHESKGWLKEELQRRKLLPETKAALWARVLSDYACL